ncbi:MAG TPA: hypothetical protein VIF83_08495, partial [Gemmatimonadaceae bacterium]
MNHSRVRLIVLQLVILSIAVSHATQAQQTTRVRKATEKPAAKTAITAAAYDSMMLSEFAWRPIGPAVTSGRVVDLAVAEGPESRVGNRLGRLMYAASAS